MQVRTIPLGPLSTNCYLVPIDSHRAALVDPGGERQKLLKLLRTENIKAEAIFLTHGHFDHTAAVAAMREEFGCPVYLHPADKALLDNADYMPVIGATVDYNDGDVIRVGDLEAHILHTPGHTPGGVTIQIGDSLFTGDTLFRGEAGRTDLVGGSYEALLASLKKLWELPGDYAVYPGHDAASTLERERQTNYYMGEAMK